MVAMANKIFGAVSVGVAASIAKKRLDQSVQGAQVHVFEENLDGPVAIKSIVELDNVGRIALEQGLALGKDDLRIRGGAVGRDDLERHDLPPSERSKGQGPAERDHAVDVGGSPVSEPLHELEIFQLVRLSAVLVTMGLALFFVDVALPLELSLRLGFFQNFHSGRRRAAEPSFFDLDVFEGPSRAVDLIHSGVGGDRDRGRSGKIR